MYSAQPNRTIAGYLNVLQVYTVGILGSSPLWLYYLLKYSTDAFLRSILVIGLIAGASLFAFRHFARTDGVLFRLLAVGFAFKIASAAGYLWVTDTVWEWRTDLLGYFENGRILAERFWMFGTLPIIKPLVSTGFAQSVVGSLFTISGASMTIGCIAFATIGFWGQYFYYRAFCVAYPKGNRFLAGLLIFLLPSIAFWPATMGKDALLEFSLGLSVYGFALLSRGRTVKSYVSLLIGLLITTMARPHMGAIVGLPMFVAIMFTNPIRGVAIPLQKAVAVLLLLGGSAYLVSRGEQFVNIESVSGATSFMEQYGERTRTGSSAFNEGAPVAVRLAYAPFLVFRPFPWEVHNTVSILASVEGLFLLALVWKKRRKIRASLAYMTSDGFMLFASLYSVIFTLIFAVSISNFGLLARQRVMALPMLCIITCAELAPFLSRNARERLMIARAYNPLRQRTPAGIPRTS